jgi:hypothetical protein
LEIPTDTLENVEILWNSPEPWRGVRRSGASVPARQEVPDFTDSLVRLVASASTAAVAVGADEGDADAAAPARTGRGGRSLGQARCIAAVTCPCAGNGIEEHRPRGRLASASRRQGRRSSRRRHGRGSGGSSGCWRSGSRVTGHERREEEEEEEGGGGSGTALPPPPLTVVHPNRAFSRGRHTHRTGSRRRPLSSTQPQRTCCAQFLLLSADHSIIYSSVRHDAASSFQLLHPRPPMCRLLSALLSSASFLPHAHALNLLNTLAHMKEQFGRYWFWIASGR